MLADPLFWLVAAPTVFLIGLSKGAFGGGMAILGVPMLALVMDPLSAAIVTALLVVAMDMVALRGFGRASWSMPDIVWLLPGLMAGIGLGYVTFSRVSPPVIGGIVGAVTLAFAAQHFLKRGLPASGVRPVAPALALACGAAGGFTTFVAHAGGPPLVIYLARRGLDKTRFAGTLIAVFTIGNLVKLPPYIALGLDRPEVFWTTLALLPVVPLGVLAGLKLHQRVSRETLFSVCYGLLAFAALKMLVDAARALS
jgi:uncharacterized protein